jgi:hypothetical protein
MPVGPVSLDGVSNLVSDHTEQAAIELVYIKQGNQIIGDAMTQLTSALNTTQSALNLLTLIQQMHNNISVAAPSAFPFNFQTGRATSTIWKYLGFANKAAAQAFLNNAAGQTNKTIPGTVAFLLNNTSGIGPASPTASYTTSVYQALYSKAASAYYSNAINPTSSLTTGSLASILNVKGLLSGQITSLSAQTSALAKGNGSLLFALKTVYAEMPTDQKSLTAWVLDNYTNPTHAASAGKIENDLTTAITAAQSLNDSQKENVRKFLFIFQEYYQSASAILSKITQVIEQMAQKISQ